VNCLSKLYDSLESDKLCLCDLSIYLERSREISMILDDL